MNNILNNILEEYPDEIFIKADGFDDAIIGIYYSKLVYSSKKCIKILVDSKLSEIDALIYFNLKIKNNKIENYPIFIDDTY